MDDGGSNGIGIGSVLLDQYRLESILGQGGVGVVYGARHTQLTSKRFAIKVLDERLVRDPNARRRFAREAFCAAGIEHEHVIQIQNVCETRSGIPFHVMEFLDGEDLDCLLARFGPLPWRRVRAMAEQICSALAAIHRAGLVHRDLKPGNCFRITRHSNRDYIKILDFGLVKHDPKRKAKEEQSYEASGTVEGLVLGTPGFMSPEQRRGNNQEIDSRSDIYSCGALLFNLLTNRLPVEGVSLREALDKHMFFDNSVVLSSSENFRLSSDLESFFRTAMHVHPGKRFQSAQELHEALLGIDVGYTHDFRMPRPEQGGHQKGSADVVSRPGPPGTELVETLVSVVQANAMGHVADVLILKHAQMHLGLDEAVLHRLLRLGVDESYFSPIDGETYLFDSRGGISARNVIVVGAPPPTEFDYGDVRDIAITALRRLRQAPQEVEFQEVAMTLHGVGIGLDENEAFNSLVEGIQRAIQNDEAPSNLRRINIVERDPRRASRLSARLEDLVPGGYLKRSVSGIQRAQEYRSPGDTRVKPYVLVLMSSNRDMEDAYQYGISGPAQSMGLLCERHDLDMSVPHSTEWLRSRIMGAKALIVHPSHGDQKEVFSIGFALGCGITTILLSDKRQPSQLGLDLGRCIEYGTIGELERRLSPELRRLAGL